MLTGAVSGGSAAQGQGPSHPGVGRRSSAHIGLSHHGPRHLLCCLFPRRVGRGPRPVGSSPAGRCDIPQTRCLIGPRLRSGPPLHHGARECSFLWRTGALLRDAPVDQSRSMPARGDAVRGPPRLELHRWRTVQSPLTRRHASGRAVALCARRCVTHGACAVSYMALPLYLLLTEAFHAPPQSEQRPSAGCRQVAWMGLIGEGREDSCLQLQNCH